MKRISLVFLVILVFLVHLEAKVTVTNLRTERLESPMSLDTPTPRFGWQIVADAQGVMQTAYHIIVASTPEKAERCEGDLWDANVKSSQSQWVRYEGRQLRSNTRGYWRISVETNKGKSEWSNVAMFNVGLLNESDWQGQWIGMDHANAWDKEEEHSQLSARYLRTEFETGKEPIRQATLYVSGLGMYEAFINGQKVGDDVLAPAPTDYRKTVLYNAYDVTSLLSPDGGKTVCLSVVLGNGRYYTMQQKKKPYKIANFGYPKLRLNLIIEYTDGTRKVISSSDKWKINADGAIRSNNEYDGEIYDATKALTDWTKPGFDDSRWEKAERVAIPLGTLRGAMSPNMKVVNTLHAKSVSQIGDAVIVDFGQNFAGWLNLRLSGTKAGDTITIRYAEKLDSTGNLWRENFRHAFSTDQYIANGKENNTWWHPTFVYHGGRYVEIKGLRSRPLSGDFIAEVVTDAIPTTGTFETTDTILQKVFRNAYWGVLANYKGLPIDCPQRDERQPWLGDRTRGCYGEAFLFDNNTLYAKWVRDITEAQREDGCIPDVAPAFWNYYSDNVTWPAALPMALDMMIRQYGDEQPMRKFYPDVKRWLEHLKYQYQQDGLMPRDKYGDWCVPPEKEELIHSEDPARVTDGTLIATAYYYRINRMMADFARMQGLTADAQQFTDEATLTKEAFNKKFLTVKRGTTTVPGHILYPDSTFYGNNTVTANLLPLTFGMIDDDYVKQEVEKNIIKNIISGNGGHVSCGVIGISWLMHGLTDMGRSDVAWHLATNKSYPSWGHMAEKGATTIWELWNGDTASPRMNSGNHVMLLGDLISWLYEDVAGIQSTDGFRHITLKPDFSVPEMNNIRASYQSIYGMIASQWKKEQGRLLWHVEIPANTEATLYLPDGTKKTLGSGSYDLNESAPDRIAMMNAKGRQVSGSPTAGRILADEWLYEEADFPQCHSASIVETTKGDLVATYFGGTKERNPDVSIWVSRKPKGSKTWTAPQMVADGVELKPLKPNPEGKVSQVVTPQKPAFKGKFMPIPEWASWKTNRGEAAIGNNYREACWNPVLYQVPGGELQLYFKIGPNVAGWKGWVCRSKDGGKTWSQREPLPDGIYGPVKNKPVLSKGRLIAPTSDERDGWKLYFEYSDDMGKTWKRSPFVEADEGMKAIQPSIIFLPDGRLQAVCRTRSRHVGITYSSDNGETWSKLQLIDTPNNNSGIDAVTLQDGSFAMICNHWPIEPDKEKGARTPLALLKSKDGIHWEHWMTLEDSPISQYSYPSIIQTKDGHIHVVYTWRRERVKHVEILP
ncbi:MAG: family 78 glycoside hydrolase catalytic domain [Prevotella sp.]|nr:family 78 glycoside hydrolase catalytic domain [Prevotella sp.]